MRPGRAGSRRRRQARSPGGAGQARPRREDSAGVGGRRAGAVRSRRRRGARPAPSFVSLSLSAAASASPAAGGTRGGRASAWRGPPPPGEWGGPWRDARGAQPAGVTPGGAGAQRPVPHPQVRAAVPAPLPSCGRPSPPVGVVSAGRTVMGPASDPSCGSFPSPPGRGGRLWAWERHGRSGPGRLAAGWGGPILGDSRGRFNVGRGARRTPASALRSQLSAEDGVAVVQPRVRRCGLRGQCDLVTQRQEAGHAPLVPLPHRLAPKPQLRETAGCVRDGFRGPRACAPASTRRGSFSGDGSPEGSGPAAQTCSRTWSLPAEFGLRRVCRALAAESRGGGRAGAAAPGCSLRRCEVLIWEVTFLCSGARRQWKVWRPLSQPSHPDKGLLFTAVSPGDSLCRALPVRANLPEIFFQLPLSLPRLLVAGRRRSAASRPFRQGSVPSSGFFLTIDSRVLRCGQSC